MDDRLEELEALEEGQILVFEGGRKLTVSRELAERFRRGDRMFVDSRRGELLHVPSAVYRAARRSVDQAIDAWGQVRSSSVDQRRSFFRHAADELGKPGSWRQIEQANREDVEAARSKGRSVGRLRIDSSSRSAMISGLVGWADRVAPANVPLSTHENPRGRVRLFRAPLGVVGFVFEGRPGVLVDACGVVSTGNAAVLRIGRDAIRTARTCMAEAIVPALREAGLPAGTVSLLEEPSHAAAWALFADERLALAVARGSGHATHLLGSIAQRAGTPVSMHGTGGAWVFTSRHTAPEELEQALVDSLDRKVCNTANTVCMTRDSAEALVEPMLRGLREAGRRKGRGFTLHAVGDAGLLLPPADAPGECIDPIGIDRLGCEWDWDETPEITFLVVSTLEEGVALFNQHSPRFVASLIGSDASEHQAFFDAIEAPFVGDGYTRWVDGQFALDRPELGLSNWEYGRLFGRGGILSGDDIYTVRARFEGRRAEPGDDGDPS